MTSYDDTNPAAAVSASSCPAKVSSVSKSSNGSGRGTTDCLFDGCVAENATGAQQPSVAANSGKIPGSSCSFSNSITSGDTRLEEAAKLYMRAETAVANGLQTCDDWLLARDLFNEAGAIFTTCGYPDEAARSFLHASVIADAFKDKEETTLTLSLAADNLQITHPALAVNVMDTLAHSFSDAGLMLQTARCRRDIAMLLEERLGDPVKAIEQYKMAVELFEGRPIGKSFSRHCMGRIAALTISQGQYTEASKILEKEAAMLPKNVPKFKQFLLALLCLLADGHGGDDRYFDSLYVTRKHFDVLQEEEREFQQGKEHMLMRELIQANDHGSLNEFDVAVFTYRSSASFTPSAVFDVLIERCRSNLYEHMEQYM